MSMDALLVVGGASLRLALPIYFFHSARTSTALLRIALVASVFVSAGATYSTPNFVVNAPTPEFAKQVGDLAEHFRDEIAMEWLGRKLPRWYKPCPILVKVGQIGAGGATSFCFDRGEVFGWKMNIQGSEERILDSVLPHEVSHTIFACHFRRPLPRWADEGAATLVEHESERNRQTLLLNQVINTSRRIPLKQLLSMKEYPKEMSQVLTLYAEGYSLASFLVQQGGKTRYLQFLQDAHERNWDEAIARHYNWLKDVNSLEKNWTQWIMAGSPILERRDGAVLAANDRQRKSPGDPIFRTQSPDAAPSDEPAERRSPRFEEESAASRNLAGVYESRPERASAPNSRTNSGWNVIPETKRLPRPSPLANRLRPTAEASGEEADRREPRFEDETQSSRTPPDSERLLAASTSDEFPLAVRNFREDARPIPDPRVPLTRKQPDFAELSSSEYDRSSSWSAFPRAETVATTARRVASAVCLLSP